MRTCRTIVCLLGVITLWPLVAFGQVQDAEPKRFEQGVLIRFEGPIDPFLEQYFYRKLDIAKKRGADLIVVEIDSPGGCAETSFSIASRLRDLDWARTVAYVPREALSGAAVVAFGCDEIVMHESAMLGDVGVIFRDENFLFQHAPEKIRSDMVTRIRKLAESKNRPPALAEAMVDMNTVVYQVTDQETGDTFYMSDAEIASDVKPDRWKKGPPVLESREGLFLEVSGDRAVELTLAQANVANVDELVARYELPESPVVLDRTGMDTFVQILNLRVVTWFLFVIGLIAIYVELHAPGIGVGALTAGLCFALFFWSRYLGGTADLLDIILFLAGIAFLGVELFVLPGFGVAGITGILLLLLSVTMASQQFLVPRTSSELTMLTNNLLVVMLSGVAFAGAALFLSRFFDSLPLLNRFVLTPHDPSTSDPPTKDAFGQTPLAIGDRGHAVSALRPAGMARFGTRRVDVVTDGDFVELSREIEIVEIQGNRIVVAEVEQG